MSDLPPFRRLRIYAFDPAASTDLKTAVVNEAVVKLNWEKTDLRPGPISEYLEVIDYDPASGGFYEPVNLNDVALLVQDGLPPSEGNPKFHQQMVYAVAMMTIRNFERALGRKVIWSTYFPGDKPPEYVERLRIYPHALREANAYYSPKKKALLFGYFRASRTNHGRNMPGGLVFSCLSHDIVAHETAHAILDGMHRRFIEASNPDVLAFHEAFADIVALFQHFTLPEALRQQVGSVRGDLGQRSALSGLARQFGEAIGHYGALRDAIDDVDPATGLPDPRKFDRTTKPHKRGAVLVAAVFDAFVAIYRTRVADLIRMTTGDGTLFPDKDLHPDLINRLTDEATKTARHVLRMCVRALDYMPPVDITFGDYLRALITADADMVTDDKWGYRIAMAEAFRRRGIYPRECRSMSVDNLLWDRPEPNSWLGNWIKTKKIESRMDRREIWSAERDLVENLQNWLRENGAQWAPELQAMGLRLDANAPTTIRRSRISKMPQFEVHSIRLANRITPDGDLRPQIVIEITQQRRGFRTKDLQERADGRSGRIEEGAAFTFRGGVTLIADQRDGTIRYCLRKHIDSDDRLELQRRFIFENSDESLGATYFGMRTRSEPFAFLHRML